MRPDVVIHDRIGTFVRWGGRQVDAERAVAPHKFNTAVRFEESGGIIRVAAKIDRVVISSPRASDMLGGGVSDLAIGRVAAGVVVEDVRVTGLVNGGIVRHNGVPVVGIAFAEDHFLEGIGAERIVGGGADNFGMRHVPLGKLSAPGPAGGEEMINAVHFDRGTTPDEPVFHFEAALFGDRAGLDQVPGIILTEGNGE